ncbi:MAG TPA: patatin-like phospholipase family protein [Acidimicrobiales bacterium]|nr:patatin-like phospholipase family protein [Acidimicrobiales bacterium]
MTSTPLPGGVFTGPSGTWHSPRWLRARRRAWGQRRVPTAFVFAGGGARGSAQIGMLQALTDRRIVPDAIYGASVGAINAAGFAGEPSAAGVEHMATLWRAITREDVFPQGRFPSPWRFFQQRESVHPNDGVRRIIQSGLRFERLEQSPVHLEVVATSLHDGQTQWFDEGPAEEAILASAALPALLPPVTIDGEAFIDGGVVDNVPIGRAIEQGAQRVFVLLCGPLHYTPHRYRRPAEAVLTAFFIAVHAKFARELSNLPAGVEVVVFTVDTEPVSGYDDFSATDVLITAGRDNAEQVLRFWESGGVGETTRLASRPESEAVLDTRSAAG